MWQYLRGRLQPSFGLFMSLNLAFKTQTWYRFLSLDYELEYSVLWRLVEMMAARVCSLMRERESCSSSGGVASTDSPSPESALHGEVWGEMHTE